MEVIWTQEALERLEDIQCYLAVQEKAPQAARDTLNRIFAREPQIQDMPLSGRVVPDYNIANLRELIEGSYRIIYQPPLSLTHKGRYKFAYHWPCPKKACLGRQNAQRHKYTWQRVKAQLFWPSLYKMRSRHHGLTR